MLNAPATYVISVVFMLITGWLFISPLFQLDQSGLDTFYRPLPAGATLGSDTDVTNIETATPDPTLAVYDQPPSTTNWPLVAVSGVAIVATVAAFVLAIKVAGRPRLR